MPLSPCASCKSEDPGLKDNAVLLLVAVRLSVCAAFLSILRALYLRTSPNPRAARESILQLGKSSEKTALPAPALGCALFKQRFLFFTHFAARQCSPGIIGTVPGWGTSPTPRQRRRISSAIFVSRASSGSCSSPKSQPVQTLA